MSNIHCSMGCSRRVYHNAYADQPIGYVICSICRNNGQFANHAKAAYSLIDKSANEALQKQIQNLKKEKEDCVAQINTFYFHKYFTNGDGLSNFLTEKLADYMQQYNTFVENIKKQQACVFLSIFSSKVTSPSQFAGSPNPLKRLSWASSPVKQKHCLPIQRQRTRTMKGELSLRRPPEMTSRRS